MELFLKLGTLKTDFAGSGRLPRSPKAVELNPHNRDNIKCSRENPVLLSWKSTLSVQTAAGQDYISMNYDLIEPYIEANYSPGDASFDLLSSSPSQIQLHKHRLLQTKIMI